MKRESIDSAITIIKTLEQASFCAYAAGGAVRDFLLGRNPEDIDIVTDATPDQVNGLFETTIEVGKEFGVVLVVIDDVQFHVTSFRSDVGVKDHRRPDKVFWTSASEDAKRRDFTINGMFATRSFLESVRNHRTQYPLNEIIDFVDGQRDLEQKIIRFIGNPQERIQEDALRIVRAVRFKNLLGFSYDFDTKHALIKHAEDIKHISSERIRDEFNKMFLDKTRTDSLRDLDQLGILKTILPEIDQLHGIQQPWKFYGSGDVFDHTLLAVKALPTDTALLVVWATLLHDIGKPDTLSMVPDKKHGGERMGFYDHHVVGAKITQRIMERLHFSRDAADHVTWLVENHMMVHEILEMRAGRQKRWLLDPRLPDLLELHRADASGKGEGRRINLDAYEQVKKLREAELAKPPPPPKLIDGNDIMKEFNLKPGPEVGQLLKLVEDAVWDGKVKTKKEAINYLHAFKTNESDSTTVQGCINVGEVADFEKDVHDWRKKLGSYFSGNQSDNVVGYILGELLANVKEHSAAGKACVSVNAINKKVRFSVDDDGIGIGGSFRKIRNIDDLTAVKQALKSQSTKPDSRGYGLITVKNLVKLLDGTIRIESGNAKAMIDQEESFSKSSRSLAGTKVAITLPKKITLTDEKFYDVISHR